MILLFIFILLYIYISYIILILLYIIYYKLWTSVIYIKISQIKKTNLESVFIFLYMIVSLTSWIACVRNLWDLAFTLTNMSISSILTSKSHIFLSISHILFLMLTSVVLVWISNLFIFKNYPSFCFLYYLCFLFKVLSSIICFFHPVCLHFLGFLNGIYYFPL